MIHHVIIVGAGPAGYTAAIYAARANLQPLMFEGPQPGGQLMITTDVENYPGFPDAMTGPELMQRFRDQAARFGTQLVPDLVSRVDFTSRPFQVWDSKGERYQAHTVIVATGASAQWLGLESETRLQSRGVSACATCDGFFFRGKEVAVVGGGDTAMEEATYLAQMCAKVTVIHRRDTLRASKIMQQRALNHPKISFLWNSTVEEVLGEDLVTGVRVKDVHSGLTREVPVQGLFVAIGHKPATTLFEGQLDLDASGYVRVLPGTTRTSVEGVFAAGDVADSIYRQAVTAAGTGCMAAIDAERWLAVNVHVTPDQPLSAPSL
ncbi:MAG: thioredoxin-disulfide reductase [Candidatus Sericytochromatia bacterium]|nr:thioredoxin-disulfide reductase [Candidatus Sericytochromatia bacterium]